MAQAQATAVITELAATAGLVDPGTRFDRLQDLGPVSTSAFGHLVVGHHAVVDALRHPGLNAEPVSAFAGSYDGDWREHPLLRLLGSSILFDTGEIHSAVRRTVAAHFTPARIAALRPVVERIVDESTSRLFASLDTAGEADLVTLFARPIPIGVTCHQLGLPVEDGPRLSSWLLAAQLGAARLRPEPDEIELLADVGQSLTEYLRGHLLEPNPDGLLAVVSEARSSGALTEDQALGLSFVLLGAGFETTSNLIANATLLLLSNRASLPDASVAQVIDETLRLESPVQLTARTATGGAVTMHGVTIESGDPVLVMIGAANRDRSVFDLPSRFVPARFTGDAGSPPPVIAFGSGMHHCLGHHLARVQAHAALDTLVPLLDGLQMVHPAPQWRASIGIRAQERLLLTHATAEPSSERKPKKTPLQKQRSKAMRSMMIGVGVSRAVHRVKRIAVRGERRVEMDRAASARQAQRSAETFGELRGVMMKLGQLASFGAAGLSEETEQILGSLQDAIEPMAPGEAERIIGEEFGRRVDELFATWNPVPIAAASIGQVHRAALHDGRVVAVKVQYTDIADAVIADLANIERTTALIGRFVARNLDAAAMSGEIRDRVLEEIDYRIEAANQRDFARRYAAHPFVRVPTVIESHSSRRVLTSEWIDGLRWRPFLDQADQLTKDRVGEIIARFHWAGWRRYGVFQADANPGNVLVAPDGAWVAFLDYGLVKRFTADEFRMAMKMGDGVFFSERPGGALRAAEEGGYLRPGHGVSAARFEEFVTPVRVMFEHTGAITQELHEAALRAAFDARAGYSDVVRVANAPPSTIFQDRLSYGLGALLADLNASADWMSLVREYRFGDPPMTPLGHEEVAWMRRRAGAAATP
jgi:predicted unusual protein kinase regulating ubiquinone biosynthesis (AarF/ABC1/UbiB family)/cytochrome P450